MKDPVLEDARRAEEKLRRLLEPRSGRPLVAPGPATAGIADHDGGMPSSCDAPEDGALLAITEPDGSVSWALRVITDASDPIALPDDEPLLQVSTIDALAKVVPQVAQALHQRRLFELVGPGAALDGLRNGTLEMLPANTGGLLGGIRPTGGGPIRYQARFRPVKVATIVGPGLGIAVASAVLGHMHMVEIRRQLARIEGKLDRVLEGQHAARYGRVLGSVEMLQDAVRSATADGPLPALQLQRLVGVDLDLRQAAVELEQLHRQYAARTEALSTAQLEAFADAFRGVRMIELDDARLLVAVAGALVMLQHRMIIHAAHAEPSTLSDHEHALQVQRARLASVETALMSLRIFHDHCRRALDEDHARVVRISTAISDRVSEQLRLDRLAVAELLAAVRRLAQGALPHSAPQVIRVDARVSPARAQAALLKAG